MRVNVCGIPHEVIECEDYFDIDAHFGQIEYMKCVIKINKNLSGEMRKEVICHEMVHGMLVHIGYSEQAQDEQFVQGLANAIMQGFTIKELD